MLHLRPTSHRSLCTTATIFAAMVLSIGAVHATSENAAAPLVDFATIEAADVARECQAALTTADDVLAAVVAIDDERRTFANTLLPLDRVGDSIGKAFGKYAFLGYVSPHETVRETARAQEETMDKYNIDLGFREDLYNAVLAYSRRPEAALLEGEQRRFLEFKLRDFRRNGFGLGVEARTAVQEMQNRLVELGLEYERNLAEWEDGIEVPPSRTAGLTEHYLAGLERRENGNYWVSLDYPDMYPFLDYAEDGELREALLRKSWNEGGEHNVELLEEAISLRHRIAEHLGYSSWAHYVTEVRMAKTPETITSFLDDLAEKIQPALTSDLAAMAELAREHDPDGKVDVWDWRYWHARQMRDEYSVDGSQVSQYFPLDRVVQGLFDITQEMFGLRYQETPDPSTWHESVRLFEVYDVGSGDLLAYFYMDLFPRDGKFGHAAAFPLRSAGVIGGRRQLPVSAIVANLTEPTDDTPSLLTHDEVETVFHEFGHILHQTLSTAELHRFAGTETEQDFVEAPSQNLEHWIWEPSVLNRFAAHHQTGERIPTEMVEGMIAAKRLNSGIRWLRQVFYASLDMRLHAAGENKDSSSIVAELHPICGFPALEDTKFQAGFGHLFGYDAAYYGYLWAKVYGDDMYTVFESQGILNPLTGMHYRKQVYEPGGTLNGEDILHNFLGREPNPRAFLRDLGIQGS